MPTKDTRAKWEAVRWNTEEAPTARHRESRTTCAGCWSGATAPRTPEPISLPGVGRIDLNGAIRAVIAYVCDTDPEANHA
ncbi:hypothetical protein ACIQ7D_29865 [Streptomyces sp. NPDC096310]|uniref:hypothetical protein n=1 Tax=Streptomyces sp. NPDC096310 TaxID=3366082 RepID=UPI0037FD7478